MFVIIATFFSFFSDPPPEPPEASESLESGASLSNLEINVKKIRNNSVSTCNFNVFGVFGK